MVGFPGGPEMKGSKISRRSAFRLVALGGIGAGLAVYRKLTAPFPPVSYLRWKVRGLLAQTFAQPSVVAIEKCPTYQDLTPDTLLRLWENAEMPSPVGKRIFIKPNLVDEIDQAAPVTTAPEVVGALIDALRTSGAKTILVGDGPAFRRDAYAVASQIGLDQVLAQRDIPFIDLNYDDPQLIRAKDGWFRETSHIWLPKSILDADLIISLAKMKTHHWAQISLSMKNLLGVLPGARYGWPKNFIHFAGIAETILGLYQALPRVVGVIDGIVGMEGDGPLFGSPVQHGILLAGNDPVALDVVGKNVMGLEDWGVSYLDLAVWAGIGQAGRLEIRGTPVQEVRRVYQRPPEIK
jgi:uncharacterized protein (DUF362 family)